MDRHAWVHYTCTCTVCTYFYMHIIHCAHVRMSLAALTWYRYFYMHNIHKSADLCNSLAKVAKKLCTSYVGPEALAPLTARPIGVGETARRIIDKAIMKVLKEDILEAAGTSQLCAVMSLDVKQPFMKCPRFLMTLKQFYSSMLPMHSTTSIALQHFITYIHSVHH